MSHPDHNAYQAVTFSGWTTSATHPASSNFFIILPIPPQPPRNAQKVATLAMLRKFLKPTVIASILILLTTLTTITKATSVTTSTSITTTTPTTTTTTTPSPPPPSTTTATPTTTTTAAPSANISATVFQLTKTSVVGKFLNNAAEETTTSLLPLQPPLNVTSTTLASFILNQKHQQQQRQRKQQQLLYLQQQRQHRQVQDVEETQQKQQQQQQQRHYQEHLLNGNVNDNKEIIKKNLDSAFVTVTSPVDIITPEPSSTHAYIPFDLDYNDPTEERALQESNARQSTINEVLTNLFPKGFSDIFRFSYAGEQETTTNVPIKLIRSTPAPFKRMPTTKTKKKGQAFIPRNTTYITVSTSVTRETRREISPGHTEIVVEKIITDPGSLRSNEEFRDGSNSISKDELLRINRAANEASVLPSLLVNPQSNSNNNSANARISEPIVILNDNYNNDDFVEAPEDDNQIAETQDVIHQVIQPPPAESTNFHVTPNHQYNVRIIHDNPVKTVQNSELIGQENPSVRNSPSYQSFVEQSKYLQNTLKEAPSRQFLKNFQNPILSQTDNQPSVNKGNFHYEQVVPQNHIQTVPPAAQQQYAHYQQQQPQAAAPLQQQQPQTLHTRIINSQHLSDKDVYQIDSAQGEQLEHTTPANIVFVTINTPLTHNIQQAANPAHTYSQEPQIIPAQQIKSPHEFVSDAMGYSHDSPQVEVDHQAQQSEDNPKPSNAGYTFVEVQKSINIHNKLITEKDGRLIEQHETIYPEAKYNHNVQQQQEPAQPQPSPDYISLSQNPIHVEPEDEQYEPAASLRDEQHTLNPSQDLSDFGTIQQSNLIQESHIIEIPQQQEQQQYHDQQEEQHHEQVYSNNEEDHLAAEDHHAAEGQYAAEVHHAPEDHHASDNHYAPVNQHAAEVHYAAEQNQASDNHYAAKNHAAEGQYPAGEQHALIGIHLTGEVPAQPVKPAYTPTVQIPYALPDREPYHPPPMVLQEIIEKHIAVPYGVPEPVGIPVHIDHFIDRPYPVETIVEKPVPYPVEKVVEKVVEKHVPVEVEKIVEKPIEVIVKKYIDRPVAIPIKIPVSLHLPASPHGPPSYGHPGAYYPSTFGGGAGGLDHASTWPQTVNGGSFTRIPQNVLKAYYAKMLKKLVPQMQQAYKNTHASKAVPKLTPKPYVKQNYKISDMLYDLKPPPPRPKAHTSWDIGARYQYDYNTLPIDLSASSSIAVGKNLERPGQGYKTNFDEFQRWRNGHSLKRSPDFGRNLHMEYGFKPPLVPSVEIDDKGVPLKSIADLTKGKEE
ncbi:putative uncharacterized protein DDB_G0271606 [Calliphora vicina]|uniref:putative uncharacterized protein DDB_G0271606 n=1 Tax=Calliphora vicina TaxID=7373 RepID=UPI00325A7D60